jgi:hypothetical protein
MLKVTCIVFAAAGLLAAGQGERRRCNLASLKGTYGTILTGTKPSGAPPAPLEQFTGLALSTFDGQGHSTGIDNIHGVLSGVIADRPGTGTYTINADCSGAATMVNQGAPPLEMKFIIVDGGKEFRGIIVSPLTVVVTFNARRL